MPRKTPRRTIAPGIYEDAHGFDIRVMVNRVPYRTRKPLDTSLADLKKALKDLASKAETETGRRPGRGTLAADVPRYLALVKNLAGWVSLRSELRAWVALLGESRRDQITAADVLTARLTWLKDGVKPKTINNRVDALRRLYRRLDGKRVLTPCDDVTPLDVERTPIQRVSPETILAVDAKLQEHERRGWIRSPKTRARFRVMVSTGRRPSEIARAQPKDVNLEARVWIPRDGKGGHTPGIYLNDEQLAAWQLFIDANAWGTFREDAFVRTLRTAGWPKDIRPYQSRHTYGITLSEMGHDLDDVGAALGHKRRETTRKHYVPVLNSRMQALSESMSGRFKGWPDAPRGDTADTATPPSAASDTSGDGHEQDR
jgi:integrase